MRKPSVLSDLYGELFDVVVMGGGAVGASATQHLAAKGLKVLLVEQGDSLAGTSSRSSRLLYSGLSYLAPPYPLWQLLLGHAMRCRGCAWCGPACSVAARSPSRCPIA